MDDYSSATPFTAMIDTSGVIYEAGIGRKRQAVGIDIQREQEYQKQIADMQKVIDNYYDKLVELGAIVPPKTPEQIAQEQAMEQAQINQGLMAAIKELTQKVSELSNGSTGHSDEYSPVTSGGNSKNNRKTGTGSSSGNSNGRKPAA
jgi:hypothetical protein